MEPMDQASVFLLLTGAFPLLLNFLQVVRRRADSQLFDWDKPFTLQPTRILAKAAGLGISLLFVAVLYLAFKEYSGDFYQPYWNLLKRMAWPFLALSPLYIIVVDSKLKEPDDFYLKLGRVVLLQERWRSLDTGEVRQHFLSWMVKGFFLPLMIVYLFQNMGRFNNAHFYRSDDFFLFFETFYHLILTFDLCLAALGYLLSLKLFDNHIRSTEPTFLGWAAALICYQPFWSFFERNYIDYTDSFQWTTWLHGYPSAMFLWGCMILLLTSTYALSTAYFGLRFSNLTHRGIITNGPYRFTKHPAYVSKCLSWLLLYVPFLSFNSSHGEAVRQTGLWLLLCLIYFVRAKTEERHLSQDPVYVQYCAWIERHGVFRRLTPAASQLARLVGIGKRPDESL